MLYLHNKHPIANKNLFYSIFVVSLGLWNALFSGKNHLLVSTQCTHSYAPLLVYCKVIPYRLENLGLLLHTSETRSLPRVATKRSTQKSETLGE